MSKLPPPEGYIGLNGSQPYAELDIEETTDKIEISSEFAYRIDSALMTGRKEGFNEGLLAGKVMMLGMLQECLLICGVSEEEALNVIKFIANRAGINNVMK